MSVESEIANIDGGMISVLVGIKAILKALEIESQSLPDGDHKNRIGHVTYYGQYVLELVKDLDEKVESFLILVEEVDK